MAAMRKGSVLRCPVCGAELSIVLPGGGRLAPRCCNEPMELTDRINPVFVCSVCGCELMHIAGPGRRLAPRCCNEPMEPLNAAA
ncbi:MAG TPA: hypothetical protein ENJ37_02680 [Deltaproteobacteria bacterium]|nr:hypothetical protein [Deltaproteobacteria bacterium]